MVRGVMLRQMRGLSASDPLAKELVRFGQKHGPWLLGCTRGDAVKLSFTSLRKALRGAPVRVDAAEPVLELGQTLSRLLGLDETDTAILLAVLAVDRLPRMSELSDWMSDNGVALPSLIGAAAGLDAREADRRVRRHLLVRLGFVSFHADWRGKVEMNLRWTFERMVDQQPEDEAAILELMVGPAQPAPLPMEAFAHIEAADFLVRLLVGAQRERAAGINILIHGPVGTGKTEFARALAHASGARLHAVGEAMEDGEEPDRADRLGAFQMGQRLLASSDRDVLLFDEMEDIIGDAQPMHGNWFRGREGSKVFVNRMIETNPVPVIWTTNALGNIDPAILRRMSHVLKLDLPSRATAMRIYERIAREEGVASDAKLAERWGDLIEHAPETAAVLRVAARAGQLAGEPEGGVAAARSLVTALRGETLPPGGVGTVDLSLYESDRPIAPLVETLAKSEHADISLLLTGPPGTGKTALAHHMARAMDRPLLVRRTSDLLSRWVGGTEANIADAFADARAQGGVLLLDEVDSLLFDRANARANWEVSQVNELLTWLEQHPLPVIAATNFAQRLDPATARRFVYKLELRALSGERLAAAFERFFGQRPPAGLGDVKGLTPGDFALVARQIRHEGTLDPEAIAARLAREAKAKPGAAQAIGF